MKSSLGIFLMLGALGVGVLSMISFFPGAASVQLMPMLVFGGVMFLSGCGAFSLAMMGLMMLWEARKEEFEAEIKRLDLTTQAKTHNAPTTQG